jgi:hypothetical protein
MSLTFYRAIKLKKIKISPEHPIAGDLLQSACWADNADFLVELLDQGFKPADQNDSGSSLIQNCIQCLHWSCDSDWFTRDRKRKDIDSSRSRETLKMIHILAKHGAKWRPMDRHQINDARKVLLKMSVDYTIELVWIMSKYDGCSRDTIEQLLRTPTMRRHIAKYQPRIEDLLKEFTTDPVNRIT